MAFLFPAALADLFEGLAIVRFTFDLGEAMETGELGSGLIVANDYGPRIWGGTCTLIPMDGVAMDRVEARLSAFRQAGREFMVTRPDRWWPAADPDGAILGAALPLIADVLQNNRSVRIKGLPPHYVLSDGDFIGWSVGGVHQLHQVFFGGEATLGGLVEVDVVPNVEFWAGGVPVVLGGASIKAVMVPGSWRGASRDPGVASGPSFSWREVAR